MRELRSIEAFCPAFHIGCQPRAIPCRLALIEANDTKYVKTPFALLRAFADDDPERLIGKGFYATEADCLEYLRSEYPWAERAEPIMGEWFDNRQLYGDVVGDGRTADRVDVSVHQIALFARGHRSFTLKQIKAGLKNLEHAAP